MEQKDLFDKFLDRFEPASFPLTLAYDVTSMESFSSEPLPAVLVDLFISDDENFEPRSVEGDFNEYAPVFKYELNEKYHACIIWKAGLGVYEYFLTIYDLEGNIIESDAIAGTYFDPKEPNHKLEYQVCEFTTADKAIIIKGILTSQEEAFDPTNSQKYLLEISDIGEFKYTIIPSI